MAGKLVPIAPCFNPRSPCGERHVQRWSIAVFDIVSTHAPLAGSDRGFAQVVEGLAVSTHAPLAGSDRIWLALTAFVLLFQPTLPLRGATCRSSTGSRTARVSTHAPLAGSDVPAATSRCHRASFQPTLPLRGATGLPVCLAWGHQFQPTLPLRGATSEERHTCPAADVSTHAPLAGSDHAALLDVSGHLVSTHAPLAGSDRGHGVLAPCRLVSTHAPLAGSDSAMANTRFFSISFQPTLPLRGATSPSGSAPTRPSCFNPRSPCGERPWEDAP